MMDDLCQQFGRPDNELGLFIPLGMLMRVLVGTSDYRGSIMRIEQPSPDCLTLHVEANDDAPLLYALRQCFENVTVDTMICINVTGTYLVCLNSDYVRQGDLDIQQLFVIKDMKELVDNEYLKVSARVSQALKVINQEVEPEQDQGENCNKPYHCSFWDYCAELHHLPRPSVFDVYGGSFKSKGDDRFFMNRKLALYREGSGWHNE